MFDNDSPCEDFYVSSNEPAVSQNKYLSFDPDIFFEIVKEVAEKENIPLEAVLGGTLERYR